MIATGNEEPKEPLTETILCRICGEVHPVEYAEEVLADGTNVQSKLLAIYRCGGKAFLCGINGMSKALDEISGKRYKIKTPFGNAYVFVSAQDLMVTVPEENFPKHAEMRGILEAMCRIASKGMKHGLKMSEIAIQIRDADMGRSTILAQVAEVLELYIATHGGRVVLRTGDEDRRKGEAR